MAQVADVIEIVAPAEAPSGAKVDISVRVKNLFDGAVSVMIGGALEYGVVPWPTISFPIWWTTVLANQECVFTGSFTMPNKKTVIYARSYWYGSDEGWHLDDEMTKEIRVGAYSFSFSLPVAGPL